MASGYQPKISDIGNIDANMDDLEEGIADLDKEEYSFMPNQEDNASASGMSDDLPIKEGNALSLKQVEALRSLGLPEDIGKAMREAPEKQGYGRYPSKKRVETVKERHKQDSSLIRKPGDDAKWEDQYKRLVEYYQLHGNCNVPRSHTRLHAHFFLLK